MSNLPILLVAGIVFCVSGLVMLTADVAGGFLMIPLGVIIFARAFYVSRKAQRP